MKLLNILVKEEIKRTSSFVNGEKVDQKYAGSTDNLDEFLTLIDNLPDSIESIDVPKELKIFNPKKIKIKGPISDSIKEKIKKLIRGLSSKAKQEKEFIKRYELNSFNGVYSKQETDPYYIKLVTDKSDEFDTNMSKGDYGSLD